MNVVLASPHFATVPKREKKGARPAKQDGKDEGTWPRSTLTYPIAYRNGPLSSPT